MPDLHFFDEGSPYLAHPLLTAERTAHEIDFVVSTLALAPPARLLDMGCGFGRHSVELARRGYDVVGVDPAPAMIAVAHEKAKEAGVPLDLHCARGEDFVTDELFDAAICLFTTLGQITDGQDNSELLPAIGAALKPGGSLIVEVAQRAMAVRNLRRGDRFGNDTDYTKVSRSLDPAGRSITETFRLISPQGSRSYRLRYRLYSRVELETLLYHSGFAVRAAYGDYHGVPLDEDRPSMLLVGVKT